ncbi:VC0807 family protein [Lactococcus nasutitermitis]|uniref:VC0807 family protein n=1 Tax=Lactococcus nasutitermitis TaxID=1652957 RepID=A0ABV9JHM5_9LACT|nr:VC0807 family protein [Lactococcus nasutitermitis]
MNSEKNQVKSAILSFIFAIILPVFAYLALKMMDFSDTLALGVASAFPVILTLYSGLKRRKINPIGMVAICGFLISILAVYLSHGNDMAFKLWHPILTGTIGIVLLFSLAINRPLLGILSKTKAIAQEISNENPEEMRLLFMFLTLYTGLIFALHSTLTIVLALILSTTEFVVISKGVDILAIILLIAGIYLIQKRLVIED